MGQIFLTSWHLRWKNNSHFSFHLLQSKSLLKYPAKDGHKKFISEAGFCEKVECMVMPHHTSAIKSANRLKWYIDFLP